MTCFNLTPDTNRGSISQPVVDDKTGNVTFTALMIVTGPIVSSFGIVTNVFTIAVYMRQGIRDSATVLFLTLSISDCVISVLGLTISAISLIGQYFKYISNIDLYSLAYYMGQARQDAYSISLITVFLMSVERCLCIASPFKVKLLFTKSRSIKTVVCVSIMFWGLLIPDYLTLGMTWTYDDKVNATRLLISYLPGRTSFTMFKVSILAGVIPVLSGVSATVSALYIVSALKSSNKFRQSSTVDNQQSGSLKISRVETNNQSYKTKTNLSERDVRLARTVIAADIILVLCNLPKYFLLAIASLELLIPEFTIIVPSKYQKLFSILSTTMFTFEAINSTSTFFVFYSLSSQFRACFKQIFCSNVNVGLVSFRK